MTEILIEAKGISKRYGARAAVEGVSLSLKSRQVMTLIGPNGSGKTTLMRLLLGLERPDSGSVTRKEGLKVGYMPQKLKIDPVFPLTVHGFLTLHTQREWPEAAELAQVCGEVGITPVLHSPMHGLSGGEQQRVMLARALLSSPELLALDEPVQGVDVTGQAEMYSLITRVARERKLAVLMVSHDLHLVMAATDEVVCMNHHVCCAGHPHSVRTDPAFTQLFGPEVAASLAVYTHHHNHVHS